MSPEERVKKARSRCGFMGDPCRENHTVCAKCAADAIRAAVEEARRETTARWRKHMDRIATEHAWRARDDHWDMLLRSMNAELEGEKP